MDLNIDSLFPIYGDQQNFNLKSLLRVAIVNSNYFKEIYLINSFQDVKF